MRIGGRTKTLDWVSVAELRLKVDQQDLARPPVTIVVSNPDGELSDSVNLAVT